MSEKEMTNFEKVKDFNRKFNLGGRDTSEFDNSDKTTDSLHLGWDLIAEEFDEFTDEHDELMDSFMMDDSDKYRIVRTKISKELADVLYVVYGYADRLGIPIDEIFNEVHRSNMSKLDKDGNPLYNSDGKLLKSDGYLPPDVDQFFKD